MSGRFERRVGVGLAMALVSALAGCLVDNPLHTASEATSGVTGSGVTGSGVTGSGVTGSGVTGSGETGSGGATSGSSGSSGGGLEALCPAGMIGSLEALPGPRENGLVVSANSEPPCPWPTVGGQPIEWCVDFNLYDLAGATGGDYGAFDLAADSTYGTAYYLVRFDSGELMSALANLPGTVVGFRFSVVLYQGAQAPPTEGSLGLLALTDVDAGWLMSEATFARARVGAGWSGGDLQASLVPLASMVVPAPPLSAEVHDEVMSGVFTLPDPTEMVQMGLSLAIRHDAPYPKPFDKGRYMVQAIDDPDFADPTLYAVVCVAP